MLLGGTMTRQEVLAKLKELLVSDFRVPEAKLTEAATFRGTMGMDSLDTVDFIYLVSKSFGIKANIAEFRDLHTLGAVADFLAVKVAQHAAGA